MGLTDKTVNLFNYMVISAVVVKVTVLIVLKATIWDYTNTIKVYFEYFICRGRLRDEFLHFLLKIWWPEGVDKIFKNWLGNQTGEDQNIEKLSGKVNRGQQWLFQSFCWSSFSFLMIIFRYRILVLLLHSCLLLFCSVYNRRTLHFVWKQLRYKECLLY